MLDGILNVSVDYLNNLGRENSIKIENVWNAVMQLADLRKILHKHETHYERKQKLPGQFSNKRAIKVSIMGNHWWDLIFCK